MHRFQTHIFHHENSASGHDGLPKNLSARNIKELSCIHKPLLYIAQVKTGLYARNDSVETTINTRNGGVKTTIGTRNGGVETTIGTRNDGIETTIGTRNGGVETTMSCCAQSQHP